MVDTVPKVSVRVRCNSGGWGQCVGQHRFLDHQYGGLNPMWYRLANIPTGIGLI